jgi:hypothetical protein
LLLRHGDTVNTEKYLTNADPNDEILLLLKESYLMTGSFTEAENVYITEVDASKLKDLAAKERQNRANAMTGMIKFK